MTMTREEYRNRLSEIYNQIGELASERSKMINDQINLIEKDLADIGLTYGMEVDILDGIIERKVTFNGVRCNSQFFIYLEFTFWSTRDDCFTEIVDINHDIKVILPQALFDYHTFMRNYQ